MRFHCINHDYGLYWPGQITNAITIFDTWLEPGSSSGMNLKLSPTLLESDHNKIHSFLCIGCQARKKYTGAVGNFAPKMQIRALENQNTAPENSHRLQ